jgi:hypothetical protein
MFILAVNSKLTIPHQGREYYDRYKKWWEFTIVVDMNDISFFFWEWQ